MATVWKPCRPTLHEYKKVCHKDGFKEPDGTCTYEVEGLNHIIKKPMFEENGVKKEFISANINVSIFNLWWNSKLPFYKPVIKRWIKTNR